MKLQVHACETLETHLQFMRRSFLHYLKSTEAFRFESKWLLTVLVYETFIGSDRFGGYTASRLNACAACFSGLIGTLRETPTAELYFH